MGTMLLVYNVFATIDIPTSGGGPLGVFPIAMSVLVVVVIIVVVVFMFSFFIHCLLLFFVI